METKAREIHAACEATHHCKTVDRRASTPKQSRVAKDTSVKGYIHSTRMCCNLDKDLAEHQAQHQHTTAAHTRIQQSCSQQC
jgi:hypothetical protein